MVDGRGHSVWQVMANTSYRLDFFQRDYVWKPEHVDALIGDLTRTFFTAWHSQDTAHNVTTYPPYFLGPFITYHLDGHRHLADGQQRFVTLLLLLTHLRRLLLQQEKEQLAITVANLICTYQYGRMTYAVDAEAYKPCFDALFDDRDFTTDGEPPAIQRIMDAHNHIAGTLTKYMRGADEAVPLFTEWLLNRVSLIEIGAHNETQAWEIFQSMNDRGVHLTPLDHLKGYLLEDCQGDRRALHAAWVDMVSGLEAIERGAAIAFIRAVIRSRFALPGNPETSPGLSPNTATHEWVRINDHRIWPDYHKGDRARFVHELLIPLAKAYRPLLRARRRPAKGIESVFYNAGNGLTDQFDLTLACLQPHDGPTVRNEKVRLIADFIDLFVVRRGVNNSSYGQKDLDELVARVITDVRSTTTTTELAKVLAHDVAGDEYTNLNALTMLRMRDGNNKDMVYYLLARMTGWLENGIKGTEIAQYVAQKGLRPYHVEHLFAASLLNYQEAVENHDQYQQSRDRIGGLVLLDGPDNSGMGAAPLAEKADWYRHHNWLAGSLAAAVYRPRSAASFKRFVKQHGLKDYFRAYAQGESVVELIESRNLLYQAIAERIWNPERLGLATAPGAPAVERTRTRKAYGVGVADLVRVGLIRPGDTLVGQHRDTTYEATVLEDARIQTSRGGAFDTPSRAAMDALDRGSWNGWTFWRLKRTGALLGELRDRYLEENGDITA
jgi:hypothetical protein